MHVSKCKQGESFSEGEIVPYGDISISPCAGILNYGQVFVLSLNIYHLIKLKLFFVPPIFPAMSSVMFLIGFV